MNDYIIDSNGEKRKRTADDAPAPIVTPVSIDVKKIWSKSFDKPLTVSKDLEKYLNRSNKNE